MGSRVGLVALVLGSEQGMVNCSSYLGSGVATRRSVIRLFGAHTMAYGTIDEEVEASYLEDRMFHALVT